MQQAIALLRDHQASAGPQAVAVLACVGYGEGSVVSTAVRAADGHEAVPLAMLLSFTRSFAAAESCPRAMRELQMAEAALQRAIEAKLLPERVALSLH
ncbi:MULTISPECIES: hypothetical protein [unclassified Variovorax]|uniref:hypothetical protein n=1 Tax=unclassified Variovorax TaxID=663243 RepID=UPI0011AF3BA0|nr:MULTISPECIES: hypothetical protein [unclassified Variovorax]